MRISDWSSDVCSSDLIGAERVAEEINSAGGTAFAQHTDLAEEGSIKAIIDATISRFGKIDVLHNNAADTRVEQMGADMRLDQMDAAVWDRDFQINTHGKMLMLSQAAPNLHQTGAGSINKPPTGVA